MEPEIFKPFGPSIVKISIPEDIISAMNSYVEEIIKDKEKLKKNDEGHKLAGNVYQEFLLATDFMKKINWANFLGLVCEKWVWREKAVKLKKFHIIKSWIVRQYKNEYNPVHFHNGNISGVGYLKIPKNITKGKKRLKTNGTIDFIHGSKSFLSNSLHNHNPKVGDMIIFPNYLMHTAYPFKREGERRSFSFNLDIDKKTFNVFYG